MFHYKVKWSSYVRRIIVWRKVCIDVADWFVADLSSNFSLLLFNVFPCLLAVKAQHTWFFIYRPYHPETQQVRFLPFWTTTLTIWKRIIWLQTVLLLMPGLQMSSLVPLLLQGLYLLMSPPRSLLLPLPAQNPAPPRYQRTYELASGQIYSTDYKFQSPRR